MRYCGQIQNTDSQSSDPESHDGLAGPGARYATDHVRADLARRSDWRVLAHIGIQGPAGSFCKWKADYPADKVSAARISFAVLLFMSIRPAQNNDASNKPTKIQ